MNKNVLLYIFFLSFTKAVIAQAIKTNAAPDTLLKHSTVRTLTDAQYNALLKGRDLNNMAYVAELNHYPLPGLLLSYKKELDLSPAQITGITSINKMLQLKKVEIGGSVIRNEHMLDSLFRTLKIDEGTIIFYSNRYGLYEGEYRTAVLQACYKTQKLLTDWQIKKFEVLQRHN